MSPPVLVAGGEDNKLYTQNARWEDKQSYEEQKAFLETWAEENISQHELEKYTRTRKCSVKERSRVILTEGLRSGNSLKTNLFSVMIAIKF